MIAQKRKPVVARSSALMRTVSVVSMEGGCEAYSRFNTPGPTFGGSQFRAAITV